MNILFDNLESLIDAPNGIEKARELILQLAVQGKLTEQDPKDEPTSELLKKIKKEKEKLIAEGKIKKQNELPPIKDVEKPFELPKGWEWVRIKEISRDWGQKTPDKKFTYIDVGSINNKDGLIQSDLSILEASKAPSRARKLIKKDTIIYSTVRPYLLNIAVVDRDFDFEPIVSTAFAIVHLLGNISNKFVFYFLRSNVFVEYVERQMKGMAYPAINDEKFFSGLIPLPPLSEQKRIVEKVNSLMALLDELEEKRELRNQKKIKLNNASLENLLTSKDNNELKTNWKRVEENFSTLYSVPENVEKLKQAILQLAVKGKLTEQDPKDESATELLKKIKKEKEKLVTEGKIRKQNELPPIKDDEIPFELPNGWEWERFQNITSVITCGMASTPTYTETGKIFLSAKNVKPYRFLPYDYKFVSEETYQKIIQNAKPELNDILLTRVGAGIGEACLIDREIDFAYYVSLTLIKPIQSFILSEYLLNYLSSPLGITNAISKTYGIGVSQGNLNVNQVRKYIIPIPPLNEQKRIIEKVNELMSMCNALEEKLTKKEATAEKLVGAVVNAVANKTNKPKMIMRI